MLHITREQRRAAERHLAKQRRKGNTMKVDLNAVLKDAQDESIIERPGLQALAQMLVDMGMTPAITERTVGGLQQFLDVKSQEGTELTARKACVNALGSYDKEATGSKIIDRVGLALKIESSDGVVEVSDEQSKDILARVKDSYSNPYIYYRIDFLFKEAAVAAKNPSPTPVSGAPASAGEVAAPAPDK